MTETDSPVLIRAGAAAKRLGKHPRTLARWSEQGILPDPIRLGPRGYRHYRADDINALLKNGQAND